MWDSVGIENLGTTSPIRQSESAANMKASEPAKEQRSLPPAATKSYNVVRY